MRAEVINRFVDLETGATVHPGSEVDMAPERIERLERANCVRRKVERATQTPPQPTAADSEQEPPKRRGRGRPRKGER